MKGILVIVRDLESNEGESIVIHDDWLLTTAGRYEMANVQVHPTTGTAVITVKRWTTEAEARG